jgi:hypothetical protein
MLLAINAEIHHVRHIRLTECTEYSGTNW